MYVLCLSFFSCFNRKGIMSILRTAVHLLLSAVRERQNSNNLKKCVLLKRSIWTMKLQSGL